MDALAQNVPIPVRMLDAPSNAFFTKEQWDTLFALMDGALPGVIPDSQRLELTDVSRFVVVPDHEFNQLVDEAVPKLPEGQTRENLVAYLSTRLMDDEKVRDDVLRTLARGTTNAPLAKLLDTMK